MKNEMIDRVSFEMQRYQLENHVNGTFFIQDGYTDAVVREGLTADDEPMDIVDDMNATAAILALREPTEEQLNAARDWSIKKYGIGVGNDEATACYQTMIDATLK